MSDFLSKTEKPREETKRKKKKGQGEGEESGA